MSLPDSSSSSSPPVAREETGYIRFEHGQDNGFDHRDRPPWNRSEYDYRHGSIVASENPRNTSTSSEDPWSCVVVVATFCVFVSMTLILGLYGTTNVWLGPNSSFLIKPTSLFVQTVIVEELGNKGSGLMLYGLNQPPQLHVLANWSEVHYLAVPNDSYKYWIQYLNKGSRVKVSYNVESLASSLYLVIAQGVDGLSEWVQDPTRPDTTLSWHLISDSGFIEQDITKSSSYYIAVGNVYLNEVKATIDIQVEGVLYDTTNAYYKCTFPNEKCTLSVPLFGTNAAVLTSPGPKLMSLPDSSSSSSPPVAREETGYIRFEHGQDTGFDHRDRPPWNRSEYDYRHGSIVASENPRNTSTSSEDPWSCVVVVATFCVFVSMTLILGLYGTTNVWLGPNSSFLIKPTSLFVQTVIVEELGNKGSGLMLYGFNQPPQLHVLANWSEVHYLAVPNDSYKYWIQYLNKGSRVKVSYNVESLASSLYLVIAQGVDGLSEWVQDPTRPDTTLSWHLISDSGFIEQDITKSSSYYIAVGNVYLNEVKATIDIQVEGVLYDTTNAYYKCTFPNEKCTLSVPLFGTNAAVLTSPGPKLNNSKNEFCAKLSYEPRCSDSTLVDFI
ncbi:hypothetical protein F2Q68_00000034 [Brassica cretica]|uniref:E3 ubiquitin-protein ligase APD1-4 N-terminal domain-containing protein n=1 Tax=Brassica cretica TaxID=69181 RepID=A0A8S9JE32_BRACR|nr:hypothetical protein F2Q68_00000034 [Brassica cretica]